jgi:YbgC/YbaW family acyl-CoA thioester hydrolase
MVEHVEQTRVGRWDIDPSGLLQPIAAFRWAEAAETALMRRLGLLDHPGRYPRRHVVADFHKPLRLDDEVELRLQVERVGRTSIAFTWGVHREDELCVEGRHTVVKVDASGRPEPIGEHVQTLLRA